MPAINTEILPAISLIIFRAIGPSRQAGSRPLRSKQAGTGGCRGRLSTTIPGPGRSRPRSRTDRRRKEPTSYQAGQSEPAGILPPWQPGGRGLSATYFSPVSVCLQPMLAQRLLPRLPERFFTPCSPIILPSVGNIFARILRTLLAAQFLFRGGHKLLGLLDTPKMLAGLSLSGWFAGLIGGAEVLGGIGLLVPRTVRPATLGRIIIRPGVVFMHIIKILDGLAKGGSAIVVLLLLVVLLVLRGRTAVRAV